MDRHQGAEPACQKAGNRTRDDERSAFHDWIVVKSAEKDG
jgi:hypothetical protein